MKNYYIVKNLIILSASKNIKQQKINFKKKIKSLSSKNAELLNENLILKFLRNSKLI